MSQYRQLKLSMVTAGIAPVSAVGNVQIAIYQALCESTYQQGMGLEIKTYSEHNGTLPPVGHTITSCSMPEMLADPHFQQSDIIFFSYWDYASLIEGLYFAPKQARKVVLFFGITRPHLFPENQERQEKGYKQAIVLNEADMVFVTSDYIAADVRSFGVAPEKIHKIPLFADPPSHNPIPLRQPSAQQIRLAFLSRFCTAKGVEQLFNALKEWKNTDWRLDIMYSYSEQTFVDSYKKMANVHFKGRIFWHFNVDNDVKADILAHADIFVMPSLHEGFCIPILEALGQGCALVHSDAGSIPEVAGELGLQYPVRDVKALTSCLEHAATARKKGLYACTEGDIPAEEWRKLAQAHVNNFKYEVFKEKLCAPLLANLPSKYGNITELLANHRVAVLNSMGMTTRALPIIPQYMVDELNKAFQHLMPAGTFAVVAEPLEQDADIKHAKQNACAAQAKVEKIYHSLSWRISAPFRSLTVMGQSLLVFAGIKDPSHEKSTRDWEEMTRYACTVEDWKQVEQKRLRKVKSLKKSFPWKVTYPIRGAYQLAAKSNFVRKLYAKITGNVYKPYKKK